jgi:hypothetical protein
MGARCDACGKRNEPRLFARYRSLRPKDVRFDRLTRWTGAVLCLGFYVLALAFDELWFVIPAYLALIFWVLALPGLRTGRRFRDRSRAERATHTKVGRIILGGLMLMSSPLSLGQDWDSWSWQWSAAYAAAFLWTWFTPNLLRRKRNES